MCRIVIVDKDKPSNILEAATVFVPPTWEDAFEICRPEIEHAAVTCERYCRENGLKMYPGPEHVFEAFKITQKNQVRVVIFGQDPYYTSYTTTSGVEIPTATGLAFSLNRDCNLQPSVRNIYKELAQSIEGFRIPGHGDLTKWAEQGVLLLNMGLTVAQGIPDSHIEAWTGFLNKLLVEINKVNPYCIYVLWGKKAQTVKQLLSRNAINHAIILEAYHPAASCYGGKTTFLGNGHFRRINEILVERGERAIDWQL